MEKTTPATDMDQLKEKWIDLNRRLERLENQTVAESRRITSHKSRTAKSDLQNYYRRFMIIGFVMGVVFPLFLLTTSSDFYPDGGWRYASAALFFIYFITAAIMDMHLFSEVGDINLAEMTVQEVVDRARTLKRRHHLFMTILIPMAIATIAIFAVPLLTDYFLIASMTIGAIIGLIIGLHAYRRMMRDYREIMEQYED